MYRPEDDRFLHTQSWLENTICSLLGGTIAEEIVYGEVSDGCTSDLQRATQIARRMVAEFGMSPKLGRVSYQTEGRSPFLPRRRLERLRLERAHRPRDRPGSPPGARRVPGQKRLQILTDRREALEEITRLPDEARVDRRRRAPNDPRQGSVRGPACLRLRRA